MHQSFLDSAKANVSDPSMTPESMQNSRLNSESKLRDLIIHNPFSMLWSILILQYLDDCLFLDSFLFFSIEKINQPIYRMETKTKGFGVGAN